MRNFLICDDKVNRQKQLLGDNFVHLTNNSQVILINNREDLEAYINNCEIIAIHSSIIGSVNDISIFLNDHKVVLENKYLILFSGSEPEWRHDSDHLIFLNVSDFYSSSLISFIETVCDPNKEVSLLRFHYGDMMQLPLILEIKHKLWLNEINDNVDFEESIDQACEILGFNAYDPNLREKVDNLYNDLTQKI